MFPLIIRIIAVKPEARLRDVIPFGMCRIGIFVKIKNIKIH